MTVRVTITGNAATPPERRTTPTGRVVTSFRVASTERYRDDATEQWKDGGSCFLKVECWNGLAENVATTVVLGMPLVVTGRMRQHDFTDSNGNARTVYEITAESIGPDLTRGRASFERVTRRFEAVPADVFDAVPAGVGPAGGGVPAPADELAAAPF